MEGISNFQIENAIKNIGDNDLNDNFVGVFPSNYMNKFIDHTSMISDKGKYPFIIPNTDSSEKTGVHWCSILDIQDGKPIIEKILLGVEQMTRTDNKITLCRKRFHLGACKMLLEEKSKKVMHFAGI